MAKFKLISFGLNVPEYDIDCKSFTVISTECLLVYQNILSASIFRQMCI